MYIGHYASAIAATSFCRQRGALTYISLSSIMPDLLMLSTNSMNSSFNYHSGKNFFLVVCATIFIGFVCRFSLKVLSLAIAVLFLHLFLDYSYQTQDSTNWYAHHLWDFSLEVAILLVASSLFVFKQKLSRNNQFFFLITVVCLIVFQGIWNFLFS